MLIPFMASARTARLIEHHIIAPPNDPVIPYPVEPTSSVLRGRGGNAYFKPMVSSEIIKTNTYNFLTSQFGYAYFEGDNGKRIYENNYVTYHTVKTEGKGTIYFVQVNSNGYTYDPIWVLDIE